MLNFLNVKQDLILCKYSKLKKSDAKWQYTFWHNRFFNPALNENIEILNFSPKKQE